MIPPTSIDGTDITGATIDGTDVTEITLDGQTVFTAGPGIDSDLTTYSLSDPQSNITNLTSNSYDYTGDRGNDPVLSKPVTMGDFTYKFDLEYTQYSNGESKLIGFAKSSSQTQDVLGVQLSSSGGNNNPFVRSIANGSASVSQSAAFTPGKNNQFTVELDYDLSNDEMVFRLIDGGTTQTTETRSVTNMSDYDTHVPIMSDGVNVSFPGSMTIEFRNPEFVSL